MHTVGSSVHTVTHPSSRRLLRAAWRLYVAATDESDTSPMPRLLSGGTHKFPLSCHPEQFTLNPTAIPGCQRDRRRDRQHCCRRRRFRGWLLRFVWGSGTAGNSSYTTSARGRVLHEYTYHVHAGQCDMEMPRCGRHVSTDLFEYRSRLGGYPGTLSEAQGTHVAFNCIPTLAALMLSPSTGANSANNSLLYSSAALSKPCIFSTVSPTVSMAHPGTEARVVGCVGTRAVTV